MSCSTLQQPGRCADRLQRLCCRQSVGLPVVDLSAQEGQDDQAPLPGHSGAAAGAGTVQLHSVVSVMHPCQALCHWLIVEPFAWRSFIKWPGALN